MSDEYDILWLQIQPRLLNFAERIKASNSTALCIVEGASTDAFLLRAYASIRKPSSDQEIAVTVDALLEGNAICLSTDVCMDDGKILAEGPKAAIQTSSVGAQENILTNWLKEFEFFLASAKVEVNNRFLEL